MGVGFEGSVPPSKLLEVAVLGTGDGVDSAGGVGKLLSKSSEEVDERSVPFFIQPSMTPFNLNCWQLVRGHESVLCPTVVHPWHAIGIPEAPGGNSIQSILTVLFSTISSAGTSCLTEVSTVTAISPGPSSGRVGSDANVHGPSLGS